MSKQDDTLYLSELLIQYHELNSFAELQDLIEQHKRNYRFFRMDIKPPFKDTPDNWEDRLEASFY